MVGVSSPPPKPRDGGTALRVRHHASPWAQLSGLLVAVFIQREASEPVKAREDVPGFFPRPGRAPFFRGNHGVIFAGLSVVNTSFEASRPWHGRTAARLHAEVLEARERTTPRCATACKLSSPVDSWVSRATEWTNMASVLRRAQSTIRMNNWAQFLLAAVARLEGRRVWPETSRPKSAGMGRTNITIKNPTTTRSRQLDYRPGAREGTAGRRSARSSR